GGSASPAPTTLLPEATGRTGLAARPPPRALRRRPTTAFARGSLGDQESFVTSRLAYVLFDHAICPQQQRGRDREAHRLRRLQVDDELEHGRFLHRQTRGIGAVGDLVDVRSRPPGHAPLARAELHAPPAATPLPTLA